MTDAAAYRLLTHRSANLGDTMQTVAMSRLLPSPSVSAPAWPPEEVGHEELPYIVNGWLRHPPLGYAGTHRAAGVFLRGPSESYLPWMKRLDKQIGARDPATHSKLARGQMASVVIGCSTLTLDPYEGPRAGEYVVDAEGPGEAMTHAISKETPFVERWKMALSALDKYRSAARVTTSRLHVTLPCLAFGTPVKALPEDRDARWSIFEYLGGTYDTFLQLDVSSIRRDFLEFMEYLLERRIVPHAPEMPR